MNIKIILSIFNKKVELMTFNSTTVENLTMKIIIIFLKIE